MATAAAATFSRPTTDVTLSSTAAQRSSLAARCNRILSVPGFVHKYPSSRTSKIIPQSLSLTSKMSKANKTAKKTVAAVAEGETPVTVESTEATEVTAEPSTIQTTDESVKTDDAPTTAATEATDTKKEGDGKKAKKSSVHDVTDFNTPIKKILNKHDPSASSAAPARKLASGIINALCEDFATIISLLVRRRKQSVCTINDARDAITLRFWNTPELKDHMVASGQKAFDTFEANKNKKNAKGGPLKNHYKAELLLPSSKIFKILKAKTQLMLRRGVEVVIAGAIEYLVSEMMQGAWEVCREAKFKTIKPLHVQRALTQDQDLHKNLSLYVLGQGTGHSVDPGYVPAVELDEFKKAVMKKEQGLIDEIPKELVDKQKKKEAAKKRKAAEAADGEPKTKKQKTTAVKAQ
jgi:histone H3/H4